MLKRVLLACFSAFLLLLPVNADTEKPFLAVYASNDFPREDWTRYKPDLIYYSTDWKTFDSFLKAASQLAGGREIELDIQVHGDKKLTCVGGTEKNPVFSDATMGYVVNHIERYLNPAKVTVFLEACYGAYVYKTTMRGNRDPQYLGYIEDCYHTPEFPIYGNGNHLGYNNIVYLQYFHNIMPLLRDLRDFEKEGLPGRKEETEKLKVGLLFLYLVWNHGNNPY
jgi:hypothetical protein